MKTAFLISMFVSSVTFASSTHKVSMKSISYDPKVLQIKAGDSVEWTNISYTEHSATSDDIAPAAPGSTPAASAPAAPVESDVKFDTGMVARKKTSKKIEFKTPGAYSYHCRIHGRSMSGKIEVTP